MTEAATRTQRPGPGAPAPVPDGARLDWLFFDLNSFFASVEQQVQPALRGRPVIVIPVESEYTCAIAASYPAKALGIKTGTSVQEARRKCPAIRCVIARHDLYVLYHEAILQEVERHIPVTQVASIDELACRLPGDFGRPAAAVALARHLKQGIRDRVGDCLTCSVGLAPNRLLAKVAADLQKPDGLTVLPPDGLPGPLLGLELKDFPGIGENMEKRLWRAGIYTVPQLWTCPLKQLRAIWGGVEGERFWHRLHGREVPDEPTQRGSLGHSHVLAPECRPVARAEEILFRLAFKAATRLRDMAHVATRLDLNLRLPDGAGLGWTARFAPTQDAAHLFQAVDALWRRFLAETGANQVKQVGVVLHGLTAVADLRQLELFPVAEAPASAEAERRAAQQAGRERLAQAVAALNHQLGREAVHFARRPNAGLTYLGRKIAFNRVPDAPAPGEAPVGVTSRV